MSFGDFSIGGGGGGIDISNHARRRWGERAPTSGGLTASTWLNAENVYAPEADADETRLVRFDGSRDILLLAHRHGDKTVVSTVLYADHDRLA